MKSYYLNLIEVLADWFMQLFFDPMYHSSNNNTKQTPVVFQKVRKVLSQIIDHLPKNARKHSVG